jgi:hypothetical protein
MATKEEFLRFPIDEYTTSIASVAPPRSGKTYIAMKCLLWWMMHNIFERYYLILPQFKNEASGLYDFLKKADKKKVFIYETYAEFIADDILKTQYKYLDLVDKGKLTRDKVPLALLLIDDATSQTKLFQSDSLLRIVTENRHIKVHSWFLMHAVKHVIDPRVRQNFNFIIVYPMKKKLLENMFDEFVDFQDDFDDYKSFREFINDHVSNQEHGCLLINGKKNYNPTIASWFENDK